MKNGKGGDGVRMESLRFFSENMEILRHRLQWEMKCKPWRLYGFEGDRDKNCIQKSRFYH